jgi:hypothetical protein
MHQNKMKENTRINKNLWFQVGSGWLIFVQGFIGWKQQGG